MRNASLCRIVTFSQNVRSAETVRRDTRLLKNLRILFGCKGGNHRLLRRRPRGERADLKLDLGKNGTFAEQARISKTNGLRIIGVDADREIIFQSRPKIRFHLRRKRLSKESDRPRVDRFVVFVLLVFAALRPRLVSLTADQPPVQDQVDVLGKAMDQIVAC